MPTVNDQDLVQQMAKEIGEARMLHLTISPAALFQLVGLLQLACRHRGPSEDVRRSAWWFIAHAREHFRDCPAVLHVIDLGDDPQFDQ